MERTHHRRAAIDMDETDEGDWLDRVAANARFVIGVGLITGLGVAGWLGIHTYDQALAAGDSPIQLVQLMVPYFYVVLLLIGAAFALYVITRGWDRPGA